MKGPDLAPFAGQKVGILGGTFDPVHNGHLAMAEAVLSQCRLDAVVLMPAASPPHKPGESITPLADRLAMLELAAFTRPGLRVSCLEACLPVPSYTIDTLRHLRACLGDRPDLFFIIGEDSFLEISTWKEYRRIAELASLVVVNRPDCGQEAVAGVLASGFGDFLREEDGVWRKKGVRGGIVLIGMAPVDVSSTMIRKLARAGEQVAGLAPPSVAAYIEERGLYR